MSLASLEGNGVDGWDVWGLGVALASSAVVESDEAVAVGGESSPGWSGVLGAGSSDEVEGVDLVGVVSSDLKWAVGVLWEGNGDSAEGLGVNVVDGVLDRVASSEAEVAGDDRADGNEVAAVARGSESGLSSWASRAGLGDEVDWDATSEASEPWEVDVTLGGERASEDSSDDLSNWVGDASRWGKDVSRESDVGDLEAGGRGSVPEKEAREGKEGLETALADANRGRSNNVDEDGLGVSETSDVNTTGVGEIGGADGEHFEGRVGTIEGHDVVAHDVDSSGWDGVGVSQLGGDWDDVVSEGVGDAELATSLEERWGVQRELAVGRSGEWWDGDGVRELASRSVSNVTNNVASNNRGGTSGNIRVSRDAAIVSGGLDEIETKRDTSEGESSSSSGSSSDVSRADGGSSLGGDLEVGQPAEGRLSALSAELGGRSNNAVALGVNTESTVGVGIADA